MGGTRRWRALAAVNALSLLLVVAGCGGGQDPDPDAAPSTTPANASPTDTGSATPEPLDPEHAVDPPGQLEDRLYFADMLIFNEDALSAEMIEQIEAIRGIEAVESIGLAQVTLENRAINVAAVDPGTYRRFTPPNSAELQEAWDRVAAGEVAITPALGKRLQDKQGELTLGGSADAPQLHIGAFAPQVKQVDAVVNEKWGEELGMDLGNALLINTGLRSPQSVRTPFERIVGDNASVQILGPDLDTSVQQTAFLTGGSAADVVGTFNYTVLGGGRIAPEPAWVSSHIGTAVMPILGSMTCNQAIFPQLEAALREVVSRGLADALHPGEYAGCYYPRFIAGSTTLSNHSFGLAMDLNVPGNQRGTVGEMDRSVVSIFKKWGFAWGGDWGYTDPMHFEMDRVVAAR